MLYDREEGNPTTTDKPKFAGRQTHRPRRQEDRHQAGSTGARRRARRRDHLCRNAARAEQTPGCAGAQPALARWRPVSARHRPRRPAHPRWHHLAADGAGADWRGGAGGRLYRRRDRRDRPAHDLGRVRELHVEAQAALHDHPRHRADADQRHAHHLHRQSGRHDQHGDRHARDADDPRDAGELPDAGYRGARRARDDDRRCHPNDRPQCRGR